MSLERKIGPVAPIAVARVAAQAVLDAACSSARRHSRSVSTPAQAPGSSSSTASATIASSCSRCTPARGARRRGTPSSVAPRPVTNTARASQTCRCSLPTSPIFSSRLSRAFARWHETPNLLATSSAVTNRNRSTHRSTASSLAASSPSHAGRPTSSAARQTVDLSPTSSSPSPQCPALDPSQPSSAAARPQPSSHHLLPERSRPPDLPIATKYMVWAGGRERGGRRSPIPTGAERQPPLGVTAERIVE